MALNGIQMVPAMMVVATMLWAGVTAQSGCTTALISLSPCLNYITGNTTIPSSSCCSQLSTVVRSQPQCLCTVLNGGASSLGIDINQTQALALPAACNVQTPPVSRCNAAGPPANSPPEGTPASPTTPSVPSNPSPTPTTPSVPSAPTGDGSKTTPSGVGGSSDGSSTKLSLTLLFSLLFMASYTSILNSFF